MATTIEIGGASIERLKGSLSISNVLAQRSTASFVVVDRTGVVAYARGQAVEIYTGENGLDDDFNYLSPVNLLTNPSFEIGDPPTGWTAYVPGGGTLVRSAAQQKLGSYSALLTNAAANTASLYQTLTNPYYQKRHMALGSWVYATTAGRVRLAISGDVSGFTYSSYHTGLGLWLWLSVPKTMGATDTFARANLVIESGGAIPAYYDGAIMVEGSLFTGFIDYPTRQRIAPDDNSLYWAIQCMDNSYLAEKRIAAESYTAQTAGFIVDDLFDKYLAEEGVTIGSIEAGPTIAEMIINYSQVSKAFDTLAARSGFIWRIDNAKKLWFTARTTTVAPFSIVASDITRDPGIESSLAEATPFYRNRQYIRAGQATTTVLQTETRKGDGVAVAFVMGYPLASLKVGVDAITVGGANQTVGLKGIDTLKDVYWSKGDAVITFTTPPGNGVSVVCSYYGLYDILVRVDSVPEQVARQAVEGGTGIIEAIDDLPNIVDKDDALVAAQANLDYYGIIGKQFTFPIRKWGLEPGQMVTVTHVPYGLSADALLVESVGITEVAPGELKYMISAVEGPELGDWTGFFKALADVKGDIMERILLGKDQVLIILANVAENWEWGESVTETVYACDVPALNLYPSLTRYPC
uniref:Uncharacterized protein n=1 Tax=viral metagenome TaxID=1070528 RepID=A0A6M3IX09_9ZZZZ